MLLYLTLSTAAVSPSCCCFDFQTHFLTQKFQLQTLITGLAGIEFTVVYAFGFNFIATVLFWKQTKILIIMLYTASKINETAEKQKFVKFLFSVLLTITASSLKERLQS